MGLSRQLLLWASRSEWLGDQCQRRAFTRRAAARFIPGETLESALAAAESFRSHGITNLITLLGENVASESDAGDVTRQYLEAMNAITTAELDCQLSVKPTQLGLDIGDDVCSQQLERLASKAANGSTLVWVDMESSAYVDRTLDLVTAAHLRHKSVGVCVQAYLHRSSDDVERLVAAGIPVRLVKGAYREPASIAIQQKREVDRNYLTLATRMIDALTTDQDSFHAFGTHDMKLISQIIHIASEDHVPRDRFEFELLYGIGTEHQLQLAAAGYGMRVLISYGTAWFRWYMRRLAERPANVWFVLKNLVWR
jgi:proline dehydrogenase